MVIFLVFWDIPTRSSRILKLFEPSYALYILYQGQYFQFSSPDLQWLTKYDINEPLPVFGRPSSYCENLTTPDSKRFFHHNVGAFLEEDKKGLRYE